MLNLILVHGAEQGLFPAALLPACTELGLQLQSISAEQTPELEDLVLVDFPDPARSIAYIRSLREQGLVCFPVLVAPERELPSVSELLRLRVAAYLPTPVTRERAMDALRQGVAQVQLFRNCYVPRDDMNQLELSLEVGRISRLYEKATTGIASCPCSLAEFNAEFGTRFSSTHIACITMQVEPPILNASFPRNPTWPYVQQEAADFFKKAGLYATLLRMSGFCGYLLAPEGRDVEALARDLYAVVRRAAVPADLVTVGFAGPTEGLDGLTEVMRGAVDALRCRLLLGTDRVIPAPQPRACRDPMHAVSREALTRMRSCVELGDQEGAGRQIAAAIEEICARPKWGAHCIYSFAAQVYELLRESARRQGPEGTSMGSEVLFFFDLDCCRTPAMVQAMLSRWVGHFMETARREAGYSEPIAASLDYIDRHLDKTLPLRELAQRVQLSTSYYSSLFKRQVGSSFCEYVQSRRIAAAMELLTTSRLTVAQVAARVGFSDYRYFSRIFARHTGVSPTQYRRRCTDPGE